MLPKSRKRRKTQAKHRKSPAGSQAEAEKQARIAMRNNNNIDPVIYYWIFDTDTMIDTMDRGSV